MDGDKNPTCARDKKSFAIDSGLDRLRVAVSSIDDLVSNICDGDACETEAERPTRSLSMILNDLPGDLIGQAERIDKAVGEIRNLLF